MPSHTPKERAKNRRAAVGSRAISTTRSATGRATATARKPAAPARKPVAPSRKPAVVAAKRKDTVRRRVR